MNPQHLHFIEIMQNIPTDIESPEVAAPVKDLNYWRIRCIGAEKSLMAAGYTDKGGEYWVPPIGPRPAFLYEPSVEFSDKARQRVLDEARVLDTLLASAKNVLAFSEDDGHISKLREDYLDYLQTLEHYDQ